MFIWLSNQGKNFYEPLSGSTNYLGAYDQFGELRRVAEGKENRDAEVKAAKAEAARSGRRYIEPRGEASKIPPETNRDLMPFPSNNKFVSQPVLTDELREEVWERVMRLGLSVRQVSAELSIDMARVGAVVRLKEIEKEWGRIGRPLARPYQRAVLSMLPKTRYNPDEELRPHESVNDLPVHAWTRNQMFLPTSESRIFTREDAAKAFHPTLLSADKRIPHPEMIELAKERSAKLPSAELAARAAAREKKELAIRTAALEKEAAREAAIKKVDKGRFEFRFTPVNIDSAGPTGRGVHGVGIRYGAPNMDRKRGSIKIPTSVE